MTGTLPTPHRSGRVGGLEMASEVSTLAPCSARSLSMRWHASHRAASPKTIMAASSIAGFLLLVWFVGCGGDGTPALATATSSDASSDAPISRRDGGSPGSVDAATPVDARPPFVDAGGRDAASIEGGVPKGGVFAQMSRLPDGGDQTVVGAAFGYYTDGDCVTTTEGACLLRACPTRDGTVLGEVSAGTITVTSSFLPTGGITLAQNPLGRYPRAPIPGWLGGEDVTITTTGGAVPAFRETLRTPKSFTVTGPVLVSGQRLPRNQDIVLSWSGGSGEVGKIGFTLWKTGGYPVHVLSCEYDFADGTATVPTATLTKLPVGSYLIGAGTYESKSFDAGAFDISLSVSSGGTGDWGGQVVLQ